MKRPADVLERTDQLAVLQSCWQTVVAAGDGQVVVVGGEAGAGKSTLVQAFCAGLSGRHSLFVGAADALFTARPLGPFLDIGVRDGPVHQAVSHGAGPYEVAMAVLAETVGEQPAVLVLEDLHWADEATFDVLRLLARRLNGWPVLIVVTYRDEIDRLHPLRILLGELPSTIVRLRVPPLSEVAVSELAAPTGVDGQELYRKTAGNAFFVTEVLAAPGDRIPDTVRDAVHARVARLGQLSRDLLEAVAIVPHQAEHWLLEQMARCDSDALDACTSTGILVVSGEHVAFRHELARVAVEQEMTLGRRLSLHRAALKALAAPPSGEPDVDRLAHHADAVGDAEAVLRYAQAAADRAVSVGAHREAAAQLSRMLRYADGLTATDRAQLLQQHSRECYLTDDAATAITSAHAAAAVRREIGDRLAEAESLLWLATVQRMDGRAVDARKSVQQALALLDHATPSRELATAYAATALAAMSDADAEQTFAAGSRAMEIAGQIGDTKTLIDVLITLGTMEMESQELREQGLAKLLRSVDMAREAGLVELVGRAYNNLVYESFAANDLAMVERCVTEAIDYCGGRRVDVWLHCALGSRAELELLRGDWDAAVETAALVLAAPGTALPRMGALTVVGLIRARRGDPDPWGPLDEAMDIARGTSELQIMLPVAVARAEVAWIEGDSTRVISETGQLVERAQRSGDNWALADLVYWRRLAGADDGEPAVRSVPRRLYLSGQPSRAAKEWMALGYPYEAALAWADTDNEVQQRVALEELQRLGARATSTAVARRLRARGVRGVPRGPRTSTTKNPSQLTQREMEVLSLLATGLRDADIAGQLFLSEKTVGHHVSSILRKFGVRSRGQAAVEAARRGLVQPGAD